MIQHGRKTAQLPKRVVVLGAKGFVGSHLTAHFKKNGVDVLALSSKDLNLLEPLSSDKLGLQLQPNDAVILVSALTPDRGRDFGTLLNNLAMANHLILALKKSKVSHVLAISSDAVFDDNASLVTEATPRAPGTYHGVMHLARETALLQSCKELQIPLMIVRPSAIYGPGDTHRGYGPNHFLVTAMESGEIALFGGGEEKRDHVYINDVVELVALCLQHKTTGSVIAVSGQAVSFMEVAEVVRALAKSVWKKDVNIKTSVRQNPVTHKHFDITEVIAAFPSFQATSLGEGLEQTIQTATK